MSESRLKTLERAIHRNDMQTFRSVLQTDDDDALFGDRQDYEQLMIKSLRLGRKRMVNHLLSRGCRVSSSSKSSSNNATTPLHLAVTKVGWSNVALKLLARGARVAVRNGGGGDDDDGDTPIHAAFACDAAGSVIDLLLERYTSRETLVNLANRDGLGLLHIACTRPRLDFVRALVDIGGSDILSQVSLHANSAYAGYTPLHFAVENGRHEIAKFLCRYEADVGILNRNGSTSLHLAVDRRDVEMIDVLLRYADWNVNHADVSGVTHFMAACAGSDAEIVRQYLRIATDTSANSLANVMSARVKDLDDVDCPFADYTPMHFAAEFGRLATVQLLIDRGAHCCATATMTTSRKSIVSPLDVARKRHHESVCALLERHCRACELCENSIPERIIVAADARANGDRQEEKSMDCNFDSNWADGQLDECCLLDVLPLPRRQNDHDDDDCELCELQEILSIDDRVHQPR